MTKYIVKVDNYFKNKFLYEGEIVDIEKSDEKFVNENWFSKVLETENIDESFVRKYAEELKDIETKSKEELVEIANNLKLSYHPNTGEEKLREKIKSFLGI